MFVFRWRTSKRFSIIAYLNQIDLQPYSNIDNSTSNVINLVRKKKRQTANIPTKPRQRSSMQTSFRIHDQLLDRQRLESKPKIDSKSTIRCIFEIRKFAQLFAKARNLYAFSGQIRPPMNLSTTLLFLALRKLSRK